MVSNRVVLPERVAGHTRVIAFPRLAHELAHNAHPDLVISAAIGEGFDALEIASVLSQSAFGGGYRVFATGIPRPQLLEAEVGRLAPEIDFSIL